MELIYIDRAEALSSFNLGFLGAVSSASASIVTGELSDKMIRLSQLSAASCNLTFSFGDIEAKAVFSFVYKSSAKTSGTIYHIVGISLNGASKLLTFDTDTGKYSFMGVESDGGFDITDWGAYEVTVNKSTGDFSVHLDNDEIISGNDTISSIDGGFVLWKNSAPQRQGGNANFDDLYVLGGSTGPYSDRLGPVRAVRAPLLSATEENFTPVGAATNIAAVNKTNLNTGSYNESPSTNGKPDRFKLDLSGVPDDKDIIAVQHQLFYRKSDIGPRRLDAVVEFDANKESKILPDNPGVFASHDPMILTEKPGGGAWDYDDLEDAEFGYEAKAGD